MKRMLALAVLLASAWAPVSLAQTASPPASAGSSQRDFTDTELKSFATALVQVSRINDNYLPIYHSAKTPEEQKAVEEKASREMLQAVEGAGMTVDQYHEILARARSNPEVANRIHEHVKEAVTR
jgi:hypothetical protein